MRCATPREKNPLEKSLRSRTAREHSTNWQVMPVNGVVPVWPRRLLDTDTMTSFERQEGNIYGGVNEPRYSTLSYTWGRFEAKTPADLASVNSSSCRLRVAGVTWTIPAIDKGRAFSAAAFEAAIKGMSAASGNRFAWVDVACIDQENYADKMAEIGRQAGIFANAHAAFVWLWTVPTAVELRGAIEDMAAVLSRWPRAATLAGWLNRDGPPGASGLSFSGRSEHEELEEFEPNETFLKRLRRSVDLILGDWWFSSLWTLQELGLKDDAWLISGDGLPVESLDVDSEYYESTDPEHGGVVDWKADMLYVSIFDVVVGLRDIFSVLQMPYLQDIFQDLRLRDIVIHICDLIRSAGYTSIPVSSNPNFYFSLARTRQTTFDLDRIYGVMSLYDIRVGAAAPGTDSSKQWTLEELEEEFAFALNAKSSILGQLFIHAEEPRAGKTWQITQQTRVPGVLSEIAGGLHVDRVANDWIQELSITRGRAPGDPARISGDATPFGGFMQYLKAEVYHPDNERGPFESRVVVQVDDYICQREKCIPYVDSLQGDREMQHAKYINATIDGLFEAFGSKRLSVIELGHKVTEWEDTPDDDGLVSSKECDFYGLLLLHEDGDQSQCQRIGIIICHDLPLEPCVRLIDGSQEKPVWKTFEGLLF